MKKIYFILGSSILLLSSVVQAQNKIFVNEYLNIGVGARGLAMGGTQAAIAQDVTSGYYNVAGLQYVDSGAQVGLMHAEYFGGNAKYDYASIAAPLRSKKQFVGFSFTRFATDNIPYTIDFVEPDGSFNYNNLKSISAGDYSFVFSYAQKVKLFKNPNIQSAIGVNAKVLYRHIGKMGNAWGAGLDAGLMLAGKGWRAGLMAKDITTTYTTWSYNLTAREKQIFAQTGNDIPVKSYEVMLPRFNVGFGKYLMKPTNKFQALLAVDFDLTTDGNRGTIIGGNTISIDPHAGLELSYKNAIFLRGGINNFQRVLDDTDTANLKKYTVYQPSLGVGFKLGQLNLDYAFTRLQTQSSPLMSHIISLMVNFHSQKKKEIKQDN